MYLTDTEARLIGKTGAAYKATQQVEQAKNSKVKQSKHQTASF